MALLALSLDILCTQKASKTPMRRGTEGDFSQQAARSSGPQCFSLQNNPASNHVSEPGPSGGPGWAFPKLAPELQSV